MTRGQQIEEFLAANGWGDADCALLAADASFRRYFRLQRGAERAVLMDAPPPLENVGAFHRVQRLLLDLGLSAPRDLAIDQEAGFLLLEDLGDLTYTQALRNGAAEEDLYSLATDVLIALHSRWPGSDQGADQGADLPAYDDARLMTEVLLLPDWYYEAVMGAAPDGALRESYAAAWQDAFAELRGVPDSLVLRDYHVDNLMVLAGRDGVASCGLLDFQDAVLGPVTYDLISLLEDARRDVSPAVSAAMRARYLEAFPDLDREAFEASYRLLGAQRSAKIIGIFTRLCRRDGKPDYLAHIPRTWRWLEGDLAHPALAGVKAWFDQHIPADKRIAPLAQDQIAPSAQDQSAPVAKDQDGVQKT